MSALASTYDGPVVFAADGVHYPATEEGAPDLSRPLRWVEGATYRDAEEGEDLHNDVHHQNRVDLVFEVEGGGGETLEVTETEAEALRAHLAEIRKGS